MNDLAASAAGALRGVGALFAARALVGVSTLVVFALMARILTQTDFGLFALAYSLSYLFAAVLEGGHGLLVVRDLAQRPREAGRYLGALILLRLLVGGPLLVITLGGVLAFGDSPAALLLVLALVAHLQVFAGLPREVLIAGDRISLAAAHSIAETVLRTAALLAAAAAFGSVLAAFVAAAVIHAAWAAAGLVLLWRTMDLKDFAAGAGEWRTILRRSLPFGAFIVLAAAYSQVDVVIVSLLMPLSAVGVFLAAFRILIAADYLPEAAWRWSYPRLSRAAMAGPSELAIQITTLSRALVFAGIGTGTLIFLVAPQLIPGLYGDRFATAVLPMQVLALTIPIRFVAHAYGAGLSAAGVQRRRSQILLAVIIISGAVQFILVSIFGLIGATAGVAISAAVLVGLYVAVARRIPQMHLGLSPVALAAAFAVGGASLLAVATSR